MGEISDPGVAPSVIPRGSRKISPQSGRRASTRSDVRTTTRNAEESALGGGKQNAKAIQAPSQRSSVGNFGRRGRCSFLRIAGGLRPGGSGRAGGKACFDQ